MQSMFLGNIEKREGRCISAMNAPLAILRVLIEESAEHQE